LKELRRAEEAARREAEAQRQRAEKNLRLARKALDELLGKIAAPLYLQRSYGNSCSKKL